MTETINSKRNKAICHHYTHDGLTMQAIGDKFGLTAPGIYYVLRINGITSGNKGIPIWVASAIELYKCGMYINKIAEELGKHRNTINRALVKSGHKVARLTRADMLDADSVRKLYKLGYSQARIAKHYGVGQQTVCVFMRDNNIAARPSRNPNYRK